TPWPCSTRAPCSRPKPGGSTSAAANTPRSHGGLLMALDEVLARWRLLRERLDTVVLGQDAVKEQLLGCLLAGGHALLALVLSRLLGCRFRRIQFTPDLMPADILGTNVFNQKTQEFQFQAGPIFADL